LGGCHGADCGPGGAKNVARGGDELCAGGG